MQWQKGHYNKLNEQNMWSPLRRQSKIPRKELKALEKSILIIACVSLVEMYERME